MEMNEVLQVGTRSGRLAAGLHSRRGPVRSGAAGRYGRLRRRRDAAVMGVAWHRRRRRGAIGRLEGCRRRPLDMEAIAERQQFRAEAAQALLQMDCFV